MRIQYEHKKFYRNKGNVRHTQLTRDPGDKDHLGKMKAHS